MTLWGLFRVSLGKRWPVFYDRHMGKFRLMLVLLAWIVVAPAGAFATTLTPRFVNVATHAGSTLPNSVISSLAEDRDGFLWAGNARGVTRFDGQSFRQYANRWGSPFGETSLFVRCLLVSRAGTLWIGTDFAGLARYDPSQDRLIPVALHGAQGENLSITALAEDIRGGLWIGTDGAGLLYLGPDGQVRVMRHEDGSGLPDDRITALLVDRNEVLWVATWQGLVAMPVDASGFGGGTGADGEAGWPVAVTALHETTDGQLWAGARDGRIWRLDALRRGSWAALDDSGAGMVHAFLQPDTDALWIGRATGLDIRSPISGALLQHVRHQPGNPWSLNSNEVRALLRDRGGLVWIGGYGGGLQHHDPHNAAFQMLDRHALAGGGSMFDDPNTRAVQVLADGRILLGTQTRGVLILDSRLEPVGVLRDGHGQALFQGDRVTGLAETVDGTVWVGADSGLYWWSPGALDPASSGLEGGTVRRMLADRHDGVWLGMEDGLHRFHPGQGTGKRVLDTEHQPVRRSINGLGYDRAGRLWVGGEFGLGWVLPGEDVLHRISALHPAQGGNTDVLGLLVDDGAVWFDTPSGLYRLNSDRAGELSIDAVSLEHGRAGQPFGANLLKDAQGRLWTQDNMFDPARGRLLQLGPADGIHLGSSWFRGYARTGDGRLLFGGTNGLLVVRPELYQEPAYDAPLVITALRIDGIDTPPAPLMAGLELALGQRRLSIEFSALDYSAPDKIRYAYRLVGETDDWVQTDADHRLVTFANLAPGSYRFELMARDRHGRGNARDLVLPIVVRPAWWQLWWVRLVGLMLLLAGMLMLLRQRTRWLRARQRELEHHVITRTRELQDVTAALHEKTLALEEASRTDPLTGLRNRRFFAQYIDGRITALLRRFGSRPRSALDEQIVGMVFFLLDIDQFKQINDRYGHAAGDSILQQLAARLETGFGAGADLVRWGGEEFLIVMPELDIARVPALADQVLRVIENPAYVLPDQRLLRCSCSLGYAPFPLQRRYPHQASWAEVLELADRALYAAKAAGRNGWVGIEADEAEPLDPNPSWHLEEELAVGRLRIHTSLSVQRVRAALVAGTS